MDSSFCMLFLSHMKCNSYLSSDSENWVLQISCAKVSSCQVGRNPEPFYQDIIIYSISPDLLMNLSALIKTLDCFDIFSSLQQEKCIQARQRGFHFKKYFRQAFSVSGKRIWSVFTPFKHKNILKFQVLINVENAISFYQHFQLHNFIPNEVI